MSAIAAQGAEGRSAASGQLELWDGLQLADPWLLGLLVLVPIALWWGRAHKARAHHLVIAPRDRSVTLAGCDSALLFEWW